MSEITRLSLSIERSLYARLEKLVAASAYGNRSEFVRDLIRHCLIEEEWKSDEELLGTISLVYDHHARGLAARLTHAQHHFAGNVLATTHVHLDDQFCAEMIMVRGTGKEITALTDRLHREKGVLYAKLATGTMGHALR